MFNILLHFFIAIIDIIKNDLKDSSSDNDSDMYGGTDESEPENDEVFLDDNIDIFLL